MRTLDRCAVAADSGEMPMASSGELLSRLGRATNARRLRRERLLDQAVRNVRREILAFVFTNKTVAECIRAEFARISAETAL